MQKEIEQTPEVVTGGLQLTADNKVQFGQRFNTSKRTVDSWLAEGLPHLKLSARMVRIPVAEGMEWVRQKYLVQRRKAVTP